jgi:hypothetical protein
MSFSTEQAKLVTDQLARFVTLNRHQLAGHVENLDFWLAEVRHSIDVMDGYNKRFTRMKAGQDRYVEEHKTTEFFKDDPSIQWKAEPPRRIPDTELRESRRALCEAVYRFLVRCCNEGFIAEVLLRQSCERLGIGIEKSDLIVRS